MSSGANLNRLYSPRSFGTSQWPCISLDWYGVSVNVSRHTQARGTYLRRLLVERFPEIFELAFCAVWVPCTPIIGTESPAKMLVPGPRDEAGTYLAVVPFPGTIFFTFLNFVLSTNALSSGLRLGFASAISSSVGSALDGPDFWLLSEA
jgi:hypothetical protein